MGKVAEQWRRTVEPHFGFVGDLGWTDVDVDDSSFWSLWVQFRSQTSAIRVSKSNEFNRSDVQLIRLVDGQVPPYPIWITKRRIDWVLLDNVVEARQPHLMADIRRHVGLGQAEVQGQLAFWARVLREVAGDFLDGDFAPLDEAAALIRQRVAERPQQVRVWVPSGSPEGAEAEQAHEIRSALPPGVAVSVHRYRRGPASSDR